MAIYPEPVAQGSLAVAAGWLSAVNHQDTARVIDLSTADIEIIAPRRTCVPGDAPDVL
jgi:hypothetical protein